MINTVAQGVLGRNRSLSVGADMSELQSYHCVFEQINHIGTTIQHGHLQSSLKCRLPNRISFDRCFCKVKTRACETLRSCAQRLGGLAVTTLPRASRSFNPALPIGVNKWTSLYLPISLIVNKWLFILHFNQKCFIMSSISTPHQNFAMPHRWGAGPTLRTTGLVQWFLTFSPSRPPKVIFLWITPPLL